MEIKRDNFLYKDIAEEAQLYVQNVSPGRYLMYLPGLTF